MSKILLVEDNLNIVKGLEYSFSKEGYDLISVSSVENFCECLKQNIWSLIILDVSLPDGNGFDIYEKKVKNLKIPTIFLTALDDEENVVKGLDLGAEDYITKPFSTKELLVRVKKILQRNRERSIVNIGSIMFDFDKMEVFKNDEIVNLSSLELKILHLLFTNLGRVVSRDAILSHIWEWTGNDVDDHTVTVYMNRIRDKLSENIIVTIKGIGYRIDGK